MGPPLELDLELRLLRAFVMVADELHFGRAAARLNITQPALSRQIRDLEDRVETRLLDRGPRGVTLTEAGRVLLGDARRLLEQAARMRDRAFQAGQGTLGHVTVGAIGSTIPTLVGPLLREMRARYGQIAFTLVEHQWETQTEGLESGRDDVAFVRDLPAGAPWSVKDLLVEPLCLVLPAGHPLAAEPRVTREQLREVLDIPFVTTRVWIETHLGRWGMHARAMDEIPSTQAILSLIAAGVGISLMPAAYGRVADKQVRFLPVEGETTTQQIAWTPAQLPPAGERLVDLAVEMFAPS